MKIGRRNKVSTSIWSYNIGLIGESGIGKTTVLFNMLEKLIPDGYLFAECGKEDGEETLEDINAVKIIDWDSEYDKKKNTVGFITLVDEILDNKSTEDWKDLKTIVYDTYDELVLIAKEEVVRRHNKEYPQKRVSSIKAAFGGYMAGDDMANKIVLDALWRLKQVGVSFIIVGHTKIRDQQDLATGETYSQLTTNMALRDFNAIKTKLHFLGVAYNDRTIAKEKSKKNEKKLVGVIQDESRKIVFRSDDFSMDSKSRFRNIVPEIPLDADELIKALQDAIESEIKDAGVSFSDREKEDAEKLADREKEIAKAEAEHKAEKELKSVIDDIKAFIKDNSDDKEKLKLIVAGAKKLGYENPVEIDNITDAKKILKLCK